MIKYKADKLYPAEIKKVKVEKETTNSVWVKFGYGHMRRKKRGEWDNYFNTFQKAKEFLLEKSKRELESLNNQIRYESELLAKIESMGEQNG